MKIKVYFIHSDKLNYKEEIYKPLLEKGLMNDFYLIFPLSEKYKTSYIKDIMQESDIIICDLAKSNFFLKLEIKAAKKLNKPIYYFIKNDDKNIKKYKLDNIYIYKDKDEFTFLVSNILYSLNQKDVILKRDNIYRLGSIEKK